MVDENKGDFEFGMGKSPPRRREGIEEAEPCSPFDPVVDLDEIRLIRS